MNYQQYTVKPRISFGPAMSRGVKGLIYLSVIIYFIQVFAGFINIPFLEYFSLRPYFVINDYYFWQLFTYNFLHGGFFHLLINMLVLYMFGSELEDVFGFLQFIIFYIVCGVGAGIVTTLFLANSFVPVVGASGAIYGLLMAYGILFPNKQVLFMFVFPMRVKWMVILFILIEFFGTIEYSRDGISHITHLGGLLFGFLYFLIFIKRKNLSRLHYDYQKRKFKNNIFVMPQNDYEVLEEDDDEKQDDDGNDRNRWN